MIIRSLQQIINARNEYAANVAKVINLDITKMTTHAVTKEYGNKVFWHLKEWDITAQERKPEQWAEAGFVKDERSDRLVIVWHPPAAPTEDQLGTIDSDRSTQHVPLGALAFTADGVDYQSVIAMTPNESLHEAIEQACDVIWNNREVASDGTVLSPMLCEFFQKLEAARRESAEKWELLGSRLTDEEPNPTPERAKALRTEYYENVLTNIAGMERLFAFYKWQKGDIGLRITSNLTKAIQKMREIDKMIIDEITMEIPADRRKQEEHLRVVVRNHMLEDMLRGLDELEAQFLRIPFRQNAGLRYSGMLTAALKRIAELTLVIEGDRALDVPTKPAEEMGVPSEAATTESAPDSKADESAPSSPMVETA